MESINFQLLASLANSTRACGVNLNPILEELGLDIDMSADPHRRLSLASFASLYKAVADRKPKHHFPFILGENFNFDGMPELATFVTSSSTVREAIRVFDWAQSLIHPALSFVMEETIEHAVLHIHVRDPLNVNNDLPGFVEGVSTAVLKFVRLLSPMGSPLLQVKFKHKPQTSLEEYAAHFGTVVEFETDKNSMIFELKALNYPLPGGVPLAHLKAEQLIVSKLLRDPNKGPLSERIENLLRSKVSLLSLPMARIAKEVGMHPRKMQRQLQDEGSSFANLLSQVRMTMACEMLQKSVLDIETISDKLGYSDRRSFTKAFTGWVGKTPREYRQQAGIDPTP